MLEQYVYDAYPSALPTPLTAGKLTVAARYHYDSDLASASGLPVIGKMGPDLRSSDWHR